jgi:hypothetical protein
MTLSSSKKRDIKLVEILREKSLEVNLENSSLPILEQIIECIMLEHEDTPEKSLEIKKKLMEEFVDWNEVRIVREERLEPFFNDLQNPKYKLKVLQAVLNKIFSRSGSLEYQFLLDLEKGDLEDYLTGIMELNESTRKMLILKVFKKAVLPFTTDHEVIFETFCTEFHPGDDSMMSLFEEVEIEILEGMRLLFDQILIENEESNSDDFSSPTLSKIIKEANVV